MSQRKVSFACDEYYHIYNRGNSKQSIFLDGGDYQRFQALLYVANGTKAFEFRGVSKSSLFDQERGDRLVYIGAYCLMPNHFHILLTPAVEQGIQLFIQKLTTSYSMYFNKKYQRTGGLFEGRFKSRHVYTDKYLKYLFSYIHLNPVKLIQADWKEVGIKDLEYVERYLHGYRYSSFSDYLHPRTEQVILEPNKFPKYFEEGKGVNGEILEWLKYRESVDENI